MGTQQQQWRLSNMVTQDDAKPLVTACHRFESEHSSRSFCWSTPFKVISGYWIFKWNWHFYLVDKSLPNNSLSESISECIKLSINKFVNDNWNKMFVFLWKHFFESRCLLFQILKLILQILRTLTIEFHFSSKICLQELLFLSFPCAYKCARVRESACKCVLECASVRMRVSAGA